MGMDVVDDQFEMKRTQHVSFNKDEVEKLNQALEIIERHGGNTSPNKFLKKEASARADNILKESKENG